ncbi:acylphosphatase [Andreprevotia lacus]|nr:acylphosphatase [Andreprevotia lacus]
MSQPTPDITACLLRVYGVVQGVGFRYSTVLAARRIGVCGWVRNRRDGSVEIHAQGAAAAVEALAAWAQHGPPSAQVERLECSDAAAGLYDGFEEHPTL